MQSMLLIVAWPFQYVTDLPKTIPPPFDNAATNGESPDSPPCVEGPGFPRARGSWALRRETAIARASPRRFQRGAWPATPKRPSLCTIRKPLGHESKKCGTRPRQISQIYSPACRGRASGVESTPSRRPYSCPWLHAAGVRLESRGAGCQPRADARQAPLP